MINNKLKIDKISNEINSVSLGNADISKTIKDLTSFDEKSYTSKILFQKDIKLSLNGDSTLAFYNFDVYLGKIKSILKYNIDCEVIVTSQFNGAIRMGKAFKIANIDNDDEAVDTWYNVGISIEKNEEDGISEVSGTIIVFVNNNIFAIKKNTIFPMIISNMGG